MPSTSTCNSATIDDFLADRLSDVQQAVFERHLDECDACCERLRQQTADVKLWDDARNYLSSTELAAESELRQQNGSHASERQAQSFDSMDADAASLTSGASAKPRLDFLAPTDDRRMLGRFAGYEISGVVGCGGMGIVLKGFDPALNRYAAIKVLSPHYASSGAARQRFAREAQAAAAVVHDNVVAIHGVSEFNDLPYLIMPYIKGQSLQKRVERHGPLSLSEILRIAMQTAKGLAAAHDQGLVHRDIKPGNILLPENVERVMITDFGLARAIDDASLTRSGVIAGTPQYMSPEQAKGEGVDHCSDLLSLGSVMYAMATGHPPFRAETPYGILRRITDHAHRPVHEVRSDMPPWLCSIIDRLLSKDVADRFASAEEVAALLEDCLAHAQQPGKVPLPDFLQRVNSVGNSDRRSRLFLIMGLLSVIIFVAVVVPWMSAANTETSGEQALILSGDEFSDDSDSENVSPVLETYLPDVAESDLEWDVSDELDQLEATLSQISEKQQEEPE